MTAAGHVLVLLVITLSVHWIHGSASCPTVPDNFLPYGPGHTHTGFILPDVNGNEFQYLFTYHMFGLKARNIKVRLNLNGSFDLEGIKYPYFKVRTTVLPRDLGDATFAERALRVGEVYIRYTINQADLDQLEAMLCVHFDGAVIITYIDVGLTATGPKSSYQVIIAHKVHLTIVLFNYGTPAVPTDRYIHNELRNITYLLDEADILDDGITVMDVTGLGTQPHAAQPCPICPDVPDTFLSFGASTSDTSIAVGFKNWQYFYYPVPYDMFGWTAPETFVILTPHGLLSFQPYQLSGSAPGVHVLPRFLGTTTKTKTLALRVGTIYMRYSTDQADLNQLDDLICDKTIDSVIIFSHICIGLTALEPMSSYQIIAAHSPNRTLLIFIYGSPSIGDQRYIRHGMSYATYPLNETDIADNGITIIDVTELPTLAHGKTLPTEEETPCPGGTCEIYADGEIKTLNGDIVHSKLTLDKNFVATVDKGWSEPNSDPCKFFLMINAENLVPTRFVRIGVGVHTQNDVKYLRKFSIPLDDDTSVTLFGQGPDEILRVADMPYTMDDSGSAIPLGITVDVTDAGDGWIIKSTTCGYSFTYLWGGNDPMVTMTLEGDRYDGRIVGTCGDIP